MHQQEANDWGNSDNNAGSNNGWGTLPVPSQTSGWDSPGGASSWSRQPQVDNGTAVWGKTSQSANSWGDLNSQTTVSAGGWNASDPSTGPIPVSVQNSGMQDKQQNPLGVQNNLNTNSQSKIPESWAAAAHIQPGQLAQLDNDPQIPTEPDVEQSNIQSQAQEQQIPISEQDSSTVDDPVQMLVNSHEGWGKRPIQQNTSWNISESPNFTRQPSIKTGTEAWSKIPPSQTVGGGWNEQSAQKPGWQGNSGNSEQNVQQWGKSANANQPGPRGWTAPSPQQPRPPWNGSQHSQVSQQTSWGDPRLPHSGTNINNSRWSTPPTSVQNSTNQGWGAPSQQGNSTTGWANPPPNTDSNAWGAAMQRNSQPASNWAGRPNVPEGAWGQQSQNVPMQRVPSQIDDGTSAWGDPTAYKNVNLWDKKQNIIMGDGNHGKTETTGWGPPSAPLVNKSSSPTGWGDANPNRANADTGTSVWNKSAKGSNWDQSSNWGPGKQSNTGGWGNAPEQPGQSWGQNDGGQVWNATSHKADSSGGKGNMDFGFLDRKPSTGSDSVFEEGQGDCNGPQMGMSGNGRPGMGYSQYNAGQANNPGMPGMNGPRQGPPHTLIGQPNLQAPMIRGQVPPMPPQLQNQYQQIRHAVMKGVIPQRMLNPQLMNQQHLNLLQQLVMKNTEYQQLVSRMNMLNKPNLPPQLRSQQEQTVRMLHQCQQQIQAHQRALTQNMLQKTNQMQGKLNAGGLVPGRVDMTPSSTLPSNNPNMSSFNMSNLAQNLPLQGKGSSAYNREQQSRLSSWKRPSLGMESGEIGGESQNNPLMSHASISDMIGDQGGLLPASAGHSSELLNQSRVTGGGLLGLQQPGGMSAIGQMNDQTGDINGSGANDFEATVSNVYSNSTHNHAPTSITDGLENEFAPPNVSDKAAIPNLNMLADIGPPEFIPGVKWKGFRPIDPENDPDITPGSVAIAKTMSVNTVKDVDQVLNRDRYTSSQVGSPSSIAGEVKPEQQIQPLASFANNLNDNPAISSTWSTGSSLGHTPTSLTHELWKVPLPKQSSISGNRIPADPRWSDSKTWVVLTGLNPQMDFTKLHNMCNIKGSMRLFKPNHPMRGMVLIKYATGEDAQFAQKSLNMSVMGNIMLVASIASDQEVNNFMTASSGNTWSTGSNQPKFSSRHSFGSSGTLMSNHQQPSNFGSPQGMHSSASTGDMQRLWPGGNGGGGFAAQPPPSVSWSTGGNFVPSSNKGNASNMWGSMPTSEDQSRMMSPLHSLLPENLLGEQTM